jgi:tyrosine-protein kinase Etk/Wzc
MQSRVDELSKVFRPLHPALIAARQQLDDTKQKLQIQMNFARQVTEAEVESLQPLIADSDARLKQAEAETFERGQTVLNGTSLYDDLDRVRSQYNALLTQLMKLDISQGFSYRTVSVLEPALVDPDPVYPKKVKGLLIAAFFGLGLGLALAFFIEYIDDSIKLAEEVERDLQLPFLGMIPAAQWSPEDLSAHRLDKLKQQGGVAESYRVVRSAIIFSIPREKLRSILLTSAVPREGKTTTCVNLSIGFAQIEDRVLLIDGDLRRGEIHKYFGLEREKGLADILLGEATPEEVIKHSSVPKLDLITSGAYPANPAELLLGWRLKELLEWAYKHYDRVIVDCTPVMGIADSAILGAAVDGVLFVIWAGRTSRRYVRVAKMTAVSRGAKIFGFVLNNLEPGRVGYYHYYPYYYSYYSRGYYYAHQDEAGKGGDVKGIEVPTQEDGKDEIDDVY